MPAQSRTRRAATASVAAVLLTALAACNHVETTGSTTPTDYRERHPIVLADAPRVLDVFVVGSRGLDARGRQDVGAFLSEYRSRGRGPLTIQVPGQDGAARAVAARIREAAGGRATVSSYQPADPAIASPVRLSFRTLQAQVGSTCGLWPEDLGASDGEFSYTNKPYWNLGCATQSNFAAQIADPVDLVRGRQTTPPDTMRRMSTIDKLRQGADPSTQWRTDSQSVRQGISQ